MNDIPGWWWIAFTLLAAGAQTARNVMQKGLIKSVGTIGATHVRFLFGMPFGLLFLAIVLMVMGRSIPALSANFFAWVVLGGLAQIAATALMLAAMNLRSFVVATAYAKTEPVQLALFGLVFLGDRLSLGTSIAIVVATAGVLMMSWPRPSVLAEPAVHADNRRSVMFGLASGGLFAISVVGFRGAIRALEADSFVLAATTTLAIGQSIQTVLLSSYLLIRSPSTLTEIFRVWRASLTAGFMGAFGSQCWFLAFAIENAARVRTLALVEILFAQAISRQLFAQGTTWREALGIALVVIGVAILLNV